MRTKTIRQVGYYISGEVEMELWGGDEGKIPFTPFIILKDIFDVKDVIMAVNDGKFGCQKLLFAEYYLYELYEGGYKEFISSHFISKRELDRYNFINNNQYIKDTHGVKYPDALSYIKYAK